MDFLMMDDPKDDDRMKFYRYQARASWTGGVQIDEDIWFLQKETPCGYWIVQDHHGEIFNRKWVSKTTRKRYAYPTKEEAMNSLYYRKKRQIKIIKNQLEIAKQTMLHIDSLKEKYEKKIG